MRYVVVLAALGALLAGPAVADASRFVSPSGNIRCLYRQWNESVTCATAVPRRSVTLYASGATAIARAFLPRAGFVLRYGRSAADGYTWCSSWPDGIECSNAWGGFHIAREGVSTW